MAHLDRDCWDNGTGLAAGENGKYMDVLAASAVEASLFGGDTFAAGWPESPSLTAREDCCYLSGLRVRDGPARGLFQLPQLRL